MSIVDGLEVVDVEKEQGNRRTGHVSANEILTQSVMEESIIIEAGEIIATRHFGCPLRVQEVLDRDRSVAREYLEHLHITFGVRFAIRAVE